MEHINGSPEIPQNIESKGMLRSSRFGLSSAFLWLWSSETISELGSQVTLLALPLTAVEVLHSSGFEVSLIQGSTLVPIIVLGLLVGAIADRVQFASY